MAFVLSSINQPLHPRLDPLAPILDLIRLLGLLVITVIACSDNYIQYILFTLSILILCQKYT
jgi:hypothetical protein